MTPTTAALDTARDLRQQFVDADGYGLAYGSHPAGTACETSDLDLVFISTARLTSDRLRELVDAVCRLHRDHGLTMDTEVDHAVKVHATGEDVINAIALRCFPTDKNGRIEAPPVVVEPWFLNSEPFRLRLLLNALTSPHTFLGGNTARYDDHRHQAERALALLTLSLHNSTVITLPEAAAVVTGHRDGTYGKDFLGYLPGPQLHSVLRRGLARLAADGIVRELRGNRYECHPDIVHAALTQLRTNTWPNTASAGDLGQ